MHVHLNYVTSRPENTSILSKMVLNNDIYLMSFNTFSNLLLLPEVMVLLLAIRATLLTPAPTYRGHLHVYGNILTSLATFLNS